MCVCVCVCACACACVRVPVCVACVYVHVCGVCVCACVWCVCACVYVGGSACLAVLLSTSDGSIMELCVPAKIGSMCVVEGGEELQGLVERSWWGESLASSSLRDRPGDRPGDVTVTGRVHNGVFLPEGRKWSMWSSGDLAGQECVINHMHSGHLSLHSIASGHCPGGAGWSASCPCSIYGQWYWSLGVVSHMC